MFLNLLVMLSATEIFYEPAEYGSTEYMLNSLATDQSIMDDHVYDVSMESRKFVSEVANAVLHRVSDLRTLESPVKVVNFKLVGDENEIGTFLVSRIDVVYEGSVVLDTGYTRIINTNDSYYYGQEIAPPNYKIAPSIR